MGRPPLRGAVVARGAFVSVQQDTSPDVAIALRRLMMSRTGAERLGLVSDLFHSAKRLASARLQAAEPIDPADLRVRLFRQLHADDLDEETVAAVIARLADSG